MTQSAQLSRVRSTLAPIVMDFCAARGGQQFHMRELEAFVRARVPTSPDSPSRILRQLRLEGLIDYVVLNRAASLYQLQAAR